MTTSVAIAAPPQRLPMRALVGLFVAGFIGILTEALPAGLLPQMARTLHETVAVTGQTVTVYAIGTAIAASPSRSPPRPGGDATSSSSRSSGRS